MRRDRSWKRALVSDPDSASMRLELATILTQLADQAGNDGERAELLRQASGQCEIAQQSDPTRLQAGRLQAEVLVELGERKEALEQYRRLTKQYADDEETNLELVAYLHTLGQDKEALQVAASVPEQMPCGSQDGICRSFDPCCGWSPAGSHGLAGALARSRPVILPGDHRSCGRLCAEG